MTPVLRRSTGDKGGGDVATQPPIRPDGVSGDEQRTVEQHEQEACNVVPGPATVGQLGVQDTDVMIAQGDVLRSPIPVQQHVVGVARVQPSGRGEPPLPQL